MLKKTLIATGLAVASASAFAAAAPVMGAPATPWYVGVGVTTSPLITDTTNVVGQNLKFDSRGWGGNGFVGYHVNKYFGTELGFDIIGQNQWKTSAPRNTIKETSRWNVHFVGNAYLPVTTWFSPFAFAGVAYMNTNIKINSATVDKFSGLGLTYGAGVEFNFQQFGVRLRYARYLPSQNVNSHSFNVGGEIVDMPQVSDTVSLDVLYRFGM